MTTNIKNSIKSLQYRTQSRPRFGLHSVAEDLNFVNNFMLICKKTVWGIKNFHERVDKNWIEKLIATEVNDCTLFCPNKRPGFLSSILQKSIYRGTFLAQTEQTCWSRSILHPNVFVETSKIGQFFCDAVFGTFPSP